MILNVIFKYDINPKTGDMKLLSKEEVTVDTTTDVVKKSTKKSTKIDDNPNPIITLESNKLVLTQGAVDLLSVDSDGRIDVKYKKVGKETKPVIGSEAAFKTKGGNKLTKSNTVSFRGVANEKLASYGDTFTLEPTNEEGIFYLVGNKNPDVTPIPDDVIDIENELELNNLEGDIDLEKFDFNL